MQYAVDASVAAKWFIPESHKENAERLLSGFLEDGIKGCRNRLKWRNDDCPVCRCVPCLCAPELCQFPHLAPPAAGSKGQAGRFIHEVRTKAGHGV
jgi:hypothetical protein